VNPIVGIEHFSIAAKDTVSLSDWYVRVLGFQVVYKNAKTPPTFFLKPAAGSMIEMIPASEKPAVRRENNDPGLTHVALSAPDFDAAVAHLQANGVTFEGEVKASGDVKAYFFRDPEGNLLHLICRPKPL